MFPPFQTINSPILDVHLIYTDVDTAEIPVGTALRSLPVHEQNEAGRMPPGTLQSRLILRRYYLRRILSDFTGIPMQTLRIDRNPGYAPKLAESGVCFSTASRYGRLLIGLSHHSPIGVDMEVPRSDFCWEDLLASHCTAAEQSRLRGLNGTEVQQTAWQLWVRKEAAAKCLGLGLRCPFREIDALGGERIQLRGVPLQGGDLHLPEGAVGAVYTGQHAFSSQDKP